MWLQFNGNRHARIIERQKDVGLVLSNTVLVTILRSISLNIKMKICYTIYYYIVIVTILLYCCSLKARVDIYDASYAHFIAYHPVHDLQPIILANCNYSLEVGKGTTVEYDFGSMEKQITERFIRGRPRLGIGVSPHECIFQSPSLRKLHGHWIQCSLFIVYCIQISVMCVLWQWAQNWTGTLIILFLIFMCMMSVPGVSVWYNFFIICEYNLCY